jgi:hypothetical protein
MRKPEAPRDLSERLDLPQIIKGLAADLRNLREGTISVRDARARADLARELLRAVRLVVEAQRYIEGQALPAPSGADLKASSGMRRGGRKTIDGDEKAHERDDERSHSAGDDLSGPADPEGA